ncbi:Exopolysaccharide receptor [Heracleum sosnowskyi]|uniref:Exopolysaccharide receptor n=1 Tax=Heracleum sosnowskyi TaxID=360622 RepID=A0AAD8IA86_9APIA|nr:Exopolysaccharide receptor [Heracleum sosnowskyi]
MRNFMPTSMASWNLLAVSFFLLLPQSLCTRFAVSTDQLPTMNPLNCSLDQSKTCSSILYQTNGLQKEEIAGYYQVNASDIKNVTNGNTQVYLVQVPCSCKNVNGTIAYFYETVYKVKQDDSFVNVSADYYSNQAWPDGGEVGSYQPGVEVPVHLLCGCVPSEAEIVVTYTVQNQDTLSKIGDDLSAEVSKIQGLNTNLAHNSTYIEADWVLFVPMELNGIPVPQDVEKMFSGHNHKWVIIIGVLAAATVLSICTLAIILLRRHRSQNYKEEDLKANVSKTMSAHKSFSLQNKHLQREDIRGFDSERPVVYSIEEIADATSDFDETRKIGEGGYGSVYFGVLGEKEVAVKKMRSNKTKEFLAELKVLCKIHHINVVELLGYASAEDYLYLVYEYVSNGSLGDHLHDPLLKGHQPLSWTARTQIALNTAKGIEYIHDHTKSRYVHRDIKTTNILLDERLRAKVADFGLAKLVGRTNEDDFVATRLVGTPGYLPPECVKELQVTTKTDVFAFGVVLAELITGQRALIRDNREPNKMKSLITVINRIFQDEDPVKVLQSVIDGNLKGSYPMEDVYRMAEIADWCLSEDPISRPEMREIVVALSQTMISSVEWEASLGGNSQVFSGVFNGR